MNDIHKWLNKIPGTLTVLLVIALGITLANLLWMVLTPAPSVAQAANRTSTNKVASLARQENYGKLIADQHLFGAIPKAAPKKVKTPKPVKPKPVKAPVNLNLKLHGIIASKTDGDGYAMISYNGKMQEVYRPGDSVPKKLPGQEKAESIGVMVTKVSKTSVTIDNNGTEQLLTLPEDSKAGRSPNNSRSTANARASVNRPKPTVIKPNNNASANNNTGTINTSGGIQTLTELREEALVNPNVLMTVITPSIVRENGQMAGIRVYPSRNRKLFRALGLRNGDIVTQVNGIVIDDQSKGMAIFQQLAESSALEIHIKRGGNEQVLTPQF